MPLIDIILAEFEKLPIKKIDSEYLWMLYDISIRRQWGGRGNPSRYGTEAYFMSRAYGRLFKIVSKKLCEIEDLDFRSRSQSQSTQFELTF
jgi:hypothetical protein